MKNFLPQLTSSTALLAVLALATVSAAHASTDVQMLPPIAPGSTDPSTCSYGGNAVLALSDTGTGGHSAINCTPVTADSSGNLVTSGTIQINKHASYGDICPTNGTLATDATTGKLLNCVSGYWLYAFGGAACSAVLINSYLDSLWGFPPGFLALAAKSLDDKIVAQYGYDMSGSYTALVQCNNGTPQAISYATPSPPAGGGGDGTGSP